MDASRPTAGQLDRSVFGLGRPGEARLVVRPGRAQRVSLAWLADGERPAPLLYGNGELASTIAIRWPTDESGLLSGEDLTEAQVLRWDLARQEQQQLEGLHRDFPVNAHDLRLTVDAGVHLSPCAHRLLDVIASSDPALRSRLDRECLDAVSALTGAPFRELGSSPTKDTP